MLYQCLAVYIFLGSFEGHESHDKKYSIYVLYMSQFNVWLVKIW
jgi:hypothetical protein